MEVVRASQTHQVPQVGRAQIAPDSRPRKVRAAPMGAQQRRTIAAIFIFQTRLMAPAMAIT